MSLQNASNTFNIWKMAFLKAGLMAFLAGYTTLQTSLNGLEWGAISPTQKFILICGVLAAMVTSIVAFLDKTISKIEGEQKDLQSQTDTESVSVMRTSIPANPPQQISGAATSPARTGAANIGETQNH